MENKVNEVIQDICSWNDFNGRLTLLDNFLLLFYLLI